MISQWQPIETAPKDGSVILLFEPESPDDGKPYIFTGYYDYKYGIETSKYWLCAEYERSEHEPTHWMSLPEAPKP